MTKIDHKKELKQLYAPSAKAFSIVDVPPMNFLMIDGSGNPNSAPEYAAAVEALYAMSYTVKFNVKRSAGGLDYSVMPLEGLWWADDPAHFITRNKETWRWTMMIMQPDFVTPALVEAARDAVEKKSLPALPRVQFEPCAEGTSAQILYVGSYDDETQTIASLHAFIRHNGGQLCGKHHEIYLNDPRKTAPARLKTVIRQPFQR